MRYFLLPLLFFSSFSLASAYLPLKVTQDSLSDIVHIAGPEVSRTYYGEMHGFPHTYQIDASGPFRLYVQILVPDIASNKNNVSGIVVREIEGTGRVEEVARLHAESAEWEKWHGRSTGDTYRKGPSFESTVSAGTYRIEVNTPDNIEKYVLMVGKEESIEYAGIFETLRRIAETKAFFGKPKWKIVESPFVYGPLVLILAIGALCWYGLRSSKKVI